MYQAWGAGRTVVSTGDKKEVRVPPSSNLIPSSPSYRSVLPAQEGEERRAPCRGITGQASKAQEVRLHIMMCCYKPSHAILSVTVSVEHLTTCVSLYTTCTSINDGPFTSSSPFTIRKRGPWSSAGCCRIKRLSGCNRYALTFTDRSVPCVTCDHVSPYMRLTMFRLMLVD